MKYVSSCCGSSITERLNGHYCDECGKLCARERKKMPDKYMKYLAKVIAMGVRNNMEDFHVKNLSDAQMKELNPLVRDAIYTVLVMINEESDKYHSELRWLTRMIPEYWEDPKFIKSIL